LSKKWVLTKTEGIIDVALLEHSVREDLNKTAQRVMGVLNPLKVVITNYPEDKVEMMEAINNPEEKAWEHARFRLPVSYTSKGKTLWKNPEEIFRLSPGLKFGYATHISLPATKL
jgi:glutaminyl-tRNA synthetase